MTIVREFTRESLTKNKVRYREVWDEGRAEMMGLAYVSKNLLLRHTSEEDGGMGHYPERITVTVEEAPSVQTGEVAQQNAALSQEAPRENGT